MIQTIFIPSKEIQVIDLRNLCKRKKQSDAIDISFCPLSTVQNSDQSFKETLTAGTKLNLEDYDFEIQDPDGVVISNTLEPAMTDQEFIIGASGLCPTTFDFNLNVNGTFKEVVTVDVFSDINITVKI